MPTRELSLPAADNILARASGPTESQPDHGSEPGPQLSDDDAANDQDHSNKSAGEDDGIERWDETLDRVVHHRVKRASAPVISELKELKSQVQQLSEGMKRIHGALDRNGAQEGDEDDGGNRRSAKRRKKERFGLLQACLISFMYYDLREVTNPMTETELEEIDFDSYNEKWRPNFLESVKHDSNKGWKALIVKGILQSETIQQEVQRGLIPQSQFDEGFISDKVLPKCWHSARKELRAKNDPEGRGKKKPEAQTRARRNESRARLAERRLKIANPEIDPPKRAKTVISAFKYDDKAIPVELLTEDVMSEDISESEYEVNNIRPRTTVEAYRESRGTQHKGVPPFYRAKKWRTIFSQMDLMWARTRKNAVPPSRYYVKERETSHTVADIPPGLHRCMIDDDWYKVMSDEQKASVLSSPEGWKVPSEQG
ncbi:hypothetical protein BDV93DRAFT_562330 [Ceratobasidium sp. AG-I]|nr:hypothetical protein BDV93DRAFT_562330 [Ceratobasidium sp. AG-I]